MSDCSSCSSPSPAAQIQQEYMKKLRGDTADMSAVDRLRQSAELDNKAASVSADKKVTDTSKAVLTGLDRGSLAANLSASLNQVQGDAPANNSLGALSAYNKGGSSAAQSVQISA